MTKTILTSYTLFLLMALAVVGVASAEASEVTGTLSSDASSNTQTSGSISGTVSSASGGGSSSGGSRSNGSGGGSSSNAPSGEVLGASTDNTQTPSFPNAGFAPHEGNTAPSYWSVMITFLRSILSF